MALLPLDELAAQFTSCTLPREQWTHVAHLRVGAWHIDRYGADEALIRLRSGIWALNASHGTANTERSGYHETVTAAYLRLIARFLADCDSAASLDHKVEALLESPLAARGVLATFWSREALTSPQARSTWVEPDLAPLPSTSPRAARSSTGDSR